MDMSEETANLAARLDAASMGGGASGSAPGSAAAPAPSLAPAGLPPMIPGFSGGSGPAPLIGVQGLSAFRPAARTPVPGAA